jgi:AcrR family transcriptional regulator
VTNPDKKQRIMQAAEELFRTRRIDEVTLDEIARQADVGKGTIYLYFSDKEDVVFQAMVSGLEEMCCLIRQIAAGNGTFHARLLRMCENIVVFFRDRRPLFRIILSEDQRVMENRGSGLRQRWRKRRKTMAEAVAVVIAQGMASGEIRADIPAGVLTEYLLGMLRARSWELEGWPEAQRSHATVVDLFLNGAGLPRPASTSHFKTT